jgi:flagellin
MALSINTNIASQNAQKNVARTQNALSKSLERLSSGLRINSAKDDAAGMAISNRFTAQIRGLDQAVRNANDGISMLQVSEGGMQEVTTILQRMREIAVQAANDTNSASDRASLQGEMDQLYSEIDRISTSTQFNGINLLDGTGGGKSFQVGANYGQIVSVDLKSVKTSDLNLNAYSPQGSLSSGRISTVTTAGLTINGTDILAAVAATAQSAAAAINGLTGTTGVTATAYNTYKGQSGVSGVASGLTINGDLITASGTMSELVKNINRDAAGVTATLNSNGSATLSNDTGADIIIGGVTTNTGLTTGTYQGYISLSSSDNLPIAVTATGGSTANLNFWGFNESTGAASIIGGTVTATNLVAGDLLINGVDVGASTGSSAADKVSAINSVKAQTGVAASATTTNTYILDFTDITSAAATDFTINGSVVNLTGATNLNDVVGSINGAVQGVVASADLSGKLVLTSASGLDITVTNAGTSTFMPATSTTHGTIALTSDKGADIKIAGKDAASIAKAGFAEQGGSSEAIGSGLSVASLANANNAIARIDAAINMISKNRSELGAVQNRLDSTISNLQNVSVNLSAANGRIMDADFAKETADMTKSQILMQAGVAMLSQAKQLPQSVLELLK